MNRLVNLLVLSSQFLNVIIFDGNPDETVSGRSYREGVLNGNAVWHRRHEMINKLFLWDDQHCRNSYLKDVKFARKIAKTEGWL